MKVLITGGSGFVGTNLIKGLGCKFEVLAPSSQELNLLDDKVVREYLKKNRFDIILHTATWNATKTSNKDTSKVLEHNLKMFFNIERCKDIYGKLIVYGSGADFSRSYWTGKMSENYFDSYVPDEQYGYSKYIINKCIEKSDNIYNLRLFGVYGPYEDWKIRFISNAICRVLFNMPILIRKNVYFDYLYIDDLVDITQKFFSSKPDFKVYNICTAQRYDLKNIAKKVLVYLNSDQKIIVDEEGLGNEYTGDNSRFETEFGLFDYTTIDDGIKKLISWYKGNRHLIEKEHLQL